MNYLGISLYTQTWLYSYASPNQPCLTDLRREIPDVNTRVTCSASVDGAQPPPAGRPTMAQSAKEWDVGGVFGR